MANTITHGSTDIVGSNAKITDAALPDSGDAGTYTSNNTQLVSIVVDAKGRVTTGSTPSINVTGVIFANTNAAGAASGSPGSFTHVANQKIHISSSAPNSDSIGNNGDIWYQTL